MCLQSLLCSFGEVIRCVTYKFNGSAPYKLFDDLNKRMHIFIKSTEDITYSHTTHLDIDELDSRWAKSVEDDVLRQTCREGHTCYPRSNPVSSGPACARGMQVRSLRAIFEWCIFFIRSTRITNFIGAVLLAAATGITHDLSRMKLRVTPSGTNRSQLSRQTVRRRLSNINLHNWSRTNQAGLRSLHERGCIVCTRTLGLA